MKSSFCIDLQKFMLIPTKFPLSLLMCYLISTEPLCEYNRQLREEKRLTTHSAMSLEKSSGTQD